MRRNPFPGLRPFEYHEYELFFGREEQYEEMIAKLSNTRFLAVVGTSGSGKSSLVKAGLLPALYGGLMMSAGPNWRIALFRPKDDPIRELSLALNHKRVFGDRSKENGSYEFRLSESTNWSNLCSRITREAKESDRNPSGRVLEVLSSDKRLVLSGVTGGGDIKDRSQLVHAFNGLLKLRHFYQPDSFRDVPFSTEMRELLESGQDNLNEEESQRLNRLLLEASFPQDIAKKIETQAQITDITLRRGDLGLIEVAREAKMLPEENLLVVVDQFEELFRYARISENGPHGNQAAAFVKLLLEASAQTEIPIYVVLTMRSDYLGDCAKFWGLPEAINKGQYLIPRLTRDQRREAIQGPIGLRGAKITPQLVNQLLNDMGDDPDQLPILQHAVMRTWDEWEKNNNDTEPIDLPHYLAIGKMAEALSIHADEAFDELPDDRSRGIAERMFRCLTERGTGHSEIRRPTRVSEILTITGASFKEFTSVIDVFRAEGRSFLLPAVRKPLRRDTLVDISHESLIRNWKRLRQWVNRETDSSNVYRRLVQTAKLHQQRQAGTLTDLEVEYALRWKNDNQPNAVWAARYHSLLSKDQKAVLGAANGQPVDNDKQIFDRAMGFLDESQSVCKRKARVRRFTKILAVACLFLVVMVPLLVRQVWSMKTEGRVRSRLAYSAEMKLAQRELDAENFAEVNRLLHDPQGVESKPFFQNLLSWEGWRDSLFPQHDDTELRSFEWNYFWKLSHSESSTLGNPYHGAIVSLAYLKDLKGSGTLAIAKRTGEILIGDPSKANEPAKPAGAPENFSFVAFASDRKHVAIARHDGSVRLWELSDDLATLTERREIRPAQATPVTALGYSPDGRYVVTVTQEVVTAWPVDANETAHEIRLSPGDKMSQISLAFSADGRWLAIGRNQVAKVVDLTTRQEVMEIPVNELSVQNPALTPALTAGTSQPPPSRNTSNASAQPIAPITCLAFSPDRQLLALGRRDSTITLWDLSERKYLLSLSGHSMEVLSVAFSDQTRGALASSSRDGGIKIWNVRALTDASYRKSLSDALSRSEEEKRLWQEAITLNGHAGPVTALTFTGDQTSLISAGDDRLLKVWSVHPRPGATEELGPGSSTSASSVAFSSDNAWLAAGRYDGSTVVWNVSQKPATGIELVPSRNAGNRVTPVAFSKNRILAVATEESNVTLWSVDNLEQKLKVLEHGHRLPVFALAFSPDGARLATGGGDKSVILWDVATGVPTPITGLQNSNALRNSDAVLSLAFSPGGQTLAIGTNKSDVILWDLSKNKEAGLLKGHSDSVTSVAFSKDGTIIATGSADTNAKLWDASSRECIATFHGHSQQVLSVAFFTDGKRLATAGEDGNVKLWDTSYEGGDQDPRNALITLRPKQGCKPAFVVATSPDGLTLAAGNVDGTVLLRYGASREEIDRQIRPPSGVVQ